MKILLTVSAILAAMATSVQGFGSLCGSNGQVDPKDLPEITATPVNYKVAFLGDAGAGSQQKAVLQLVKNWGAQVVIHSGDFEYQDNPSLFESNLNAVLGDSFPYFASIGNHDYDTWTGSSGHQARLINRLKKFGGDKNCTGDYGVNMACNWNGLYFVLSGVGTRGSGHVNFIDTTFNSKPAIWKFVSWHKNQRLMQIGGKSDETGWDVYDATRNHGAILVTAHEHSYCRSYAMSNFRSQVIANKNATVNIKNGESFVFVSGLAGQSIRSWTESLKNNPWWAATAASNNGVSDGALLCTFNYNGNARLARCTFQDRAGKTWDTFDVYSQNAATAEELKAQLEQAKEASKSTCRNRFIEIPIKRGNADAFEAEDGTVTCTQSKINFKNAVASSLRFEGIPLKQGARVKQAFLQVYGASDVSEQPSLLIQGSTQGFSCRASHDLTGKKLTAASALWEQEDEGWERHTVWVSPNLKEVVNEVLASPEFDGDLTLTLTGKGTVSFYSFDRSPCHAPTLALELEDEC